MIHFTLIEVQLPANVSYFHSHLLPIVLFDIVPTDYVYPYILPAPHTDEAIGQRFEATGYESQYLHENLGSVFLLISTIGPMLLAVHLMKHCCGWSPRMMAFRYHVLDRFFWNGAIMLLHENYMIMLLSAVINVKHGSKFESGTTGICFLWSLVLLVLLAAYPFFFYFKFLKYSKQNVKLDLVEDQEFESSDEEEKISAVIEFRAKYGEVLAGLNLTRLKRKAVFYPLLEVIRNIVVVFIVMMMRDHVTFQIQGLFMIITA